MGKRHKRPEPDTLTGVIAARIKSLGLSAYAVAKMSGTDTSTVRRLIIGERTPTLDTADRICKAIDLVLVVKPN
jgi:transcriptional regulator with XRE-family HTH domain